MKSYIAVAALIAAVQAQTSAPACVNTCIGLMLNQATALGCASSSDIACLCAKPDFGYGVTDCSNESCPSGTDVAGALKTLLATYCPSGTVPSASSSASGAASSLASSVSASSSASGSGGAGGAAASSVPVSTEGTYTTVTTDGSTITSLVSASKTLYGVVTTNSEGSTITSTITGAAESASSGASSASGSASSAASGASASASSVAASASSHASSVASSASSGASSAGGSATSHASSAASSATSSGGAPLITAAANFGLAGLAAVMLL